MKSDSATNVKNNFSVYLDSVKRGEVVLILEYGRPVAQISKPVLPQSATDGLPALEREGLVSLPQKQPLNPDEFLSQRIRLTQNISLLSSLLIEREESL